MLNLKRTNITTLNIGSKLLELISSVILIWTISNRLSELLFSYWLIVNSIRSFLSLTRGGVELSVRNSIMSNTLINNRIIGDLIGSSLLRYLKIILTSSILYILLSSFNIIERIVVGAPEYLIQLLLISFALDLLASVANPIYYYLNRSFLPYFFNGFARIVALLAILILGMEGKQLLICIMLIPSGIKFIISLFFTLKYYYLYMFSGLKIESKKSLEFWIIQVSLAIIVSADQIIINNFLGYDQAAKFGLALRFFTYITLIYGASINNFWPRITASIANKNKIELLKIDKKLLYYTYIGVILVIIVYPFANLLVFKWTGIRIEQKLLIPMGFYAIFQIINGYYFTYSNASGNIRLGSKLFLIGAILNIPLSIILIKITGLSVSVLVPTFIAYGLHYTYLTRIRKEILL